MEEKQLKIRKRKNNENPPHFIDVIKTKGYDVIGP